MIGKHFADDYSLTCDYCGEEDDEIFDTFNEAVEHKKEYGWRSVKGGDGEWYDLCPSCNTPEVVVKLKGINVVPAINTPVKEDMNKVEDLIKSMEERDAKKAERRNQRRKK